VSLGLETAHSDGPLRCTTLSQGFSAGDSGSQAIGLRIRGFTG
jgi:hypothetical protein